MSYVKNSSGDELDVILVVAQPKYEKMESTQKLLNGHWHTQSVGTRAKKLIVSLFAAYSVVQELLGYADTKESMSIDFLGTIDTGFIMTLPEFNIEIPGTDPLYSVGFEMAVVSSV